MSEFDLIPCFDQGRTFAGLRTSKIAGWTGWGLEWWGKVTPLGESHELRQVVDRSRCLLFFCL